MTRMNPLHTAELVAQHTRMTGEYFDQTRGTGRSTALALKFLSQAIEAPYKAIRISDHSSEPCTVGNLQRDKTLMIMVAYMVKCLGFKHINFNYRECTITFGEARPTVLPTFAAPIPASAPTTRRMTATEALEAMRRDSQAAYEKMHGR